jgi:4-amino-4-deoxy-L-arabinose transferase-like glycosyltransferase
MDGQHRRGLARAPLAGLAALDLVLHLVAAGRYGFHRDELYLLSCARRLDWGAVDHGPLVPALSWLARALGGPAPLAQRVPDAIAGALVLWLAGLCAWRLGAGGRGQLLAAASVMVAPVFVYAAGVHGTNAFDQLGWTALAYLAIRALTPGAPAWCWTAFGAVLGAGLLAKYTVLMWAGALVLAACLGPARVQLKTWGLALGGLLAGLIALPNLAWQQAHGWPMIAFARASHRAASQRWPPLLAVADQLLLLGPLALALAALGLRAGLGRGATAVGRVLALAFVVVFGLVVAAGGKPYYLAPAYPPLFALGAVAAEPLLARAPRLLLVAWTIAGALAFALTLPVLPGSWAARSAVLRAHPERAQFADWRQLVAQIARAHDSRPIAPGVRRDLLTDSYGTAAALELYGPAFHLPAPLSGANGFHLWGAATLDDAPTELVVSGYPLALLSTLCRQLEPIGEVTSPLGLDNRFDFPRTLYLCRGLTRPLRALWPALTRFD